MMYDLLWTTRSGLNFELFSQMIRVLVTKIRVNYGKKRRDNRLTEHFSMFQPRWPKTSKGKLMLHDYQMLMADFSCCSPTEKEVLTQFFSS